MRFILRSTLVVVLAALSMTATAFPAAAVVTPTPVKTDPSVDEYYPAASQDFLSWETYATGRFTVYAQPRPTGAKWKVNSSRTSGCCSSALPGTNSIVYQQYTNSNSDLYLYNMASKTRKKLPAKVNTKFWEYWGVASSGYVAFMRITSSARVLLLYNRSTGNASQVASVKPGCSSCLRPDWVGATHMIYQQCSKSFVCKLRIWRKGASTLTIPNPNGSPYSQYGAAMDEASGAIYYVRSTSWCGLFVEIRRVNVASLGTFTTIYDFPEGIDGNHVSLAPDRAVPTDTDLLFSQYDCIENNSDIYQIESVNTL
jgi:hypothetical protein